MQTLNFDLTKAYLDLVSIYVSLMILLSRVEDRKAVLGLFNAAHELTHNHRSYLDIVILFNPKMLTLLFVCSDVSFPRLGQMIMDYDPPLKKLSEEFIPHSKLLVSALLSLQHVYLRRNLTADKWRYAQSATKVICFTEPVVYRSAQMLSLTSNQNQMLNPAQTDTMPCEYLSLDSFERWIICE